MTKTGMFPDAGMELLSPLERFRSIRLAAAAAESASAKLESLGRNHPDLDATLEAYDAACGTIIDLICDPCAAESMREFEAFLEVAYGRAG